MQILSPHDQPAAQGPDSSFAGRVRVDNVFAMPSPARSAAAIVTFEPGARTAWHTHPHGQLLLILSGEGWVQSEGAPRQTIRAGDTVWFAPDERHWHGATARSAMSHVAIQEAKDGTTVTWQEQVSEADYLG